MRGSKSQTPVIGNIYVIVYVTFLVNIFSKKLMSVIAKINTVVTKVKHRL